MALQEAKNLSNELQDYLGTITETITNDNLVRSFDLVSKVMHKILEANGADIQGKPSMKQYVDVIDQLCTLSEEQKQNIYEYLVKPQGALASDPSTELTEENKQWILVTANAFNRVLWGKCISGNGRGGNNTLHLWIGDVEESITEDDLRSHFSKYGEVVKVDVKHDKNSAYVDIAKNASSDSILTMDHEIKGVKLNVDKNWTKGRWRRWGRWNRGNWGGYGAGRGGDGSKSFTPY